MQFSQKSIFKSVENQSKLCKIYTTYRQGLDGKINMLGFFGAFLTFFAMKKGNVDEGTKNRAGFFRTIQVVYKVLTRFAHLHCSMTLANFILRSVVKSIFKVVPRSAPLLGLSFQSTALKRQCGENSCFPRTPGSMPQAFNLMRLASAVSRLRRDQRAKIF